MNSQTERGNDKNCRFYFRRGERLLALLSLVSVRVLKKRTAIRPYKIRLINGLCSCLFVPFRAFSCLFVQFVDNNAVT